MNPACDVSFITIDIDSFDCLLFLVIRFDFEIHIRLLRLALAIIVTSVGYPF
jgi:hypothetical protein